MEGGQEHRRHPGRTLVLDVPLALLLGAVVLIATHGQAFWGQGAVHEGPRAFGPDGVGLAAVAPGLSAYLGIGAATAAVAMRRLWPRAGLVVASGAVLGFYVAGNDPGPILWLLAFVVFSAAIALPLPRFLPWTVPVVPAVLAGSLDQPYLGLLEAEHVARIVGTLVGLTVVAALGALIRAGRQSAQREREAELHRHAYAERLRIAREVHDVVGHSLSVISMQAGVALHVLDKRPDQAAPALQVIRTTSKEALDELRGTLAVFRGQSGEEPQPAAPPPGVARLEDLVASVEDGTRTVRLHCQAPPGVLPGAVDHAAYRIVQEALTNAVRHAPQAAVDVRVGYGPRSMVIEVTDNGPARLEHPPTEGGGLAGMRERAAAVGGTLRATPRPEGGFAVLAELPLSQDTAKLDDTAKPSDTAKPDEAAKPDDTAQED